MKTHTTIGYNMLNLSNRPMLKEAAIIALEHHEHYDGNGYPDRKKAEGISLAGRVSAIADVFDALSSKRCYKEAWQIDEVLTYIKERRGTQFDPHLIDLMFNNLEKFFAISKHLSD
jgi:response regulator RpfG family c-di-GMP phosphodiesterase